MSQELGPKQYRWFDDRYPEKVGVVAYEHCVVVHPPSALGGMTVKWLADPRLSVPLAELLQRGLERIGDVYEDLERQDMVALREALSL